MGSFGFSGLWKAIGSTVIAAALTVGDALLTYFNAINLPAWAHGLVAIAVALLAFYKGKQAPPVSAVP